VTQIVQSTASDDSTGPPIRTAGNLIH